MLLKNGKHNIKVAQKVTLGKCQREQVLFKGSILEHAFHQLYKTMLRCPFPMLGFCSRLWLTQVSDTADLRWHGGELRNRVLNIHVGEWD